MQLHLISYNFLLVIQHCLKAEQRCLITTKRRTFSPEFKREVADLVLHQSYSYPILVEMQKAFILLLLSTGVISVLPLGWYSIAAKKLTVLSLSFLQFIPPSCNFFIGCICISRTTRFI